MGRLRLFIFMALVVALAALPWGVDLAYSNAGPQGVTFYANSPAGINPVTLSNTGTPLRKFVDGLPGLGPTNANNLGQYIPIAVKDTTTYPGSDYYRIGIVQYTEKVHSDLPKATKFRGYKDNMGAGQPVHYLGPVIVAQRDRPVRVLFQNQLPTGAAGNLFIPVDPTLMGAGVGPDMMNSYTENRTAIHNHGIFGTWMSDGTPYQWFTPAAEVTPYKKGVSLRNVPDMPDPGLGANTLYYPNQQSNRLMFYHDHAMGITRLNVYAGMAAGYLIWDTVEDGLITSGVIPGATMPAEYRFGIPLVIQDKSFVPQDVAIQDSKWNTTKWGTYGDLWFPHVYEPNQIPPGTVGGDPSGMNPYGRWDFGPWVQPNILAPENPNVPARKAVLPLPGTTVDNPGAYPTSVVPESFMDTMMVNGTLYPYVTVEPKAYRFRILNACNDRFLNLQLYQADTGGGGAGALATAAVAVPGGPITSLTLTRSGAGYTSAPGVYIQSGGGAGATAVATLTPLPRPA